MKGKGEGKRREERGARSGEERRDAVGDSGPVMAIFPHVEPKYTFSLLLEKLFKIYTIIEQQQQSPPRCVFDDAQVISHCFDGADRNFISLSGRWGDGGFASPVGSSLPLPRFWAQGSRMLVAHSGTFSQRVSLPHCSSLAICSPSESSDTWEMLAWPQKEKAWGETMGRMLFSGLQLSPGPEEEWRAHVLYHKILGTLHLLCRPENTQRDSV